MTHVGLPVWLQLPRQHARQLRAIFFEPKYSTVAIPSEPKRFHGASNRLPQLDFWKILDVT